MDENEAIVIFSEHRGILEFSQWGEENIVQEIFKYVPATKYRNRQCVEFGAADGLFCSNTAYLWKYQNWEAHLIESDDQFISALLQNTQDYDNVVAEKAMVERLDQFVANPVDLVSMDVDGLEYSILWHMKVNHKVLIVEHNPTFPPNMKFVGAQNQGSSAASIIELVARRGYHFLTSTLTNLFFIHDDFWAPFEKLDYDYSLEANFDTSSLNYVVTDYLGNYALKGLFPYGLTTPVSMEIEAEVPQQNLEYITRQIPKFSNIAYSRFTELPEVDPPEL